MFSKRWPSYTSKASPEHDRFSGVSVSPSVFVEQHIVGYFERVGVNSNVRVFSTAWYMIYKFIAGVVRIYLRFTIIIIIENYPYEQLKINYNYYHYNYCMRATLLSRLLSLTHSHGLLVKGLIVLYLLFYVFLHHYQFTHS